MNLKRFITVVLLCCLCSASVFAEDQLLNAANPICYGEEIFKERVKEHSNGHEPVGLVLSGGSARALAHIGVLKYLEENNVVPDFIVSNSMGSIVGVLYSAGLSPDQITRILEKADLGKLFDLSLPVNCGLINADYAIAMIRDILGKNLKIEDLAIPMVILAEDYVTKRQVRLCSGDVYSALKASFAMPLFMSPVDYDGHILTDGGVVNLTPASVAYDYGKNNIVATTFYDPQNVNYHNPVQSVMGVMDISKRRFGVTDIMSCPDVLWIRCDVEEMSFMNFDDLSEMISRGYSSCSQYQDQIAEISKISRKTDSKMYELRAKYNKSIDSFFKRYNKLEYLELGKTINYFNAPFNSYSGPQYTLRSGMSLGIGYLVTNGKFRINPNLGAVFNIESGNTFIKPAAIADFRFFASESIRLDVNGVFCSLRDWNVSQSLTAKLGALTLGQSFEMNQDKNTVLAVFAEWEKDNICMDAAFELWNAQPAVSAKVSYGYLFDNLPLKIDFNFDGRVFIKDNTGTEFGSEVALLWNNRGENPTLAQLILISDLNAGIYGKVDYTLGEKPEICAGLTSDFTAKLIGLVGIPSSFKVGYNFTKHSIDYKVRFSF